MRSHESPYYVVISVMMVTAAMATVTFVTAPVMVRPVRVMVVIVKVIVMVITTKVTKATVTIKTGHSDGHDDHRKGHQCHSDGPLIVTLMDTLCYSDGPNSLPAGRPVANDGEIRSILYICSDEESTEQLHKDSGQLHVQPLQVRTHSLRCPAC